MASSLKYLHILTILLILFFELSWTQDNYVRYRCSQGTFFDFDQNICKPCSLECPRNQIIKKECQEKSDLECMPFKYINLIDTSYDEVESDTEMQGTTNRDGPRGNDRSSNHPSNQPSNHPTAMETEDQEYWKALAFALIGLLSVLIVASVAVLFACCRLQRAVATKQQEDGDTVDTDSDYVVIRAIRTAGDPRPYDPNLGGHPAPHSPLLPTTSDYGGSDSLQDFHCTHQPPQCFLPKVYNPQRRMLAYDTDDVFESEDSGGSVRFSSLQRVRATPWRPDHNLARPV